MYKIHKIQLPKKVGKSTYPPTPVTPPALSFGERSKVGNILWSQSQTRECHIKRLSLEDAKRELKQKQVLFNGRPEEWKGKNIVAKKHEFLSEKEMDKLKPRTPTYFEMMHRQNPIYQGAQEEDKTSVSLTSDIGTAIKYMRGTDGEVVLIDQERLPEARKGGGTSVLEGGIWRGGGSP